MLVMLRLLIATALLSACAATDFDPACPRLITYSEGQQAQAADELLGLSDGSVVADMIGDYGVVRNEIRVCRGDT